MKATTKSNKTHGLFYSLLIQMPNFNAKYKDVMKEGLVAEFTKGSTESLSAMYEHYPAEYSRMIEAMKGAVKRLQKDNAHGDDAEGEMWRKRCIAAVCAWLDLRGAKFEGKKAKTNYAIVCVCRAASCSDFNKITIAQLTRIYNEYLQKKKVVMKAAPITDFEICEN